MRLPVPVICKSSDILVRSGPVKNVDSGIEVSPVQRGKKKSTEVHSRAIQLTLYFEPDLPAAKRLT